jgi:hypothetical protein
VDDVNALTEELNQLRIKLRNGKLRRHRLLMELRTLEQKKESANQVKNVFHDTTTTANVNVNTDSIQEQISGVVLMGKEGLVELNESGKAMIQTLNDVKASRGEKKKDETLEFGRLMKEKALEAQRPMKKMTLEEDYEQRKNMNLMTGGGSSRVVSNLLNKGQDTTKSNDE